MKKSLKPFKKVKRRNLIITIPGILCTLIIISVLYCKPFIIGSIVSSSEIIVTHTEMIDALTFEIVLELSPDSDIIVINNNWSRKK